MQAFQPGLFPFPFGAETNSADLSECLMSLLVRLPLEERSRRTLSRVSKDGKGGNSATRPPDKCRIWLRPARCSRIVTLDGAALFGIDANCHEPLSQGGLLLRAIWHNGDITDIDCSKAA